MNIRIGKTVALLVVPLAKLHNFCIKNARDTDVSASTAHYEWLSKINGACPLGDS